MGNKEQKRFTIFDLKKFDGKEGRPAYVALKGKVYDVSDSPLWKEGKHPGAHTAGLDLTLSILNAPHSEEALMKFEVVGELVQERYGRQQLVRRVQKLHLHPILVHFSIAYSVLVPLLSFLYVFTQEASFEIASYYVLLLGFLSAPLGGLSGVFSWRVTYEGRPTRIFIRKILFTVVLTLVVTILSGWRTLDPNILTQTTSLSYIYLALTASLVPTAMILGRYGGKIVYP